MQPRKIVVMRHAESQEDIDKSVYAHTADLDVPLSADGISQAMNVRLTLAELLDSKRIHVYMSPGLRLKQTYDLLTASFGDDFRFSHTVEPQIQKQFWGDVTVENRREIEIARYREGVLVYQFPNGESGPQLIRRFESFVESLREDFAREDFPENMIVLTHGFEMRLFLMVWFGWDTRYFERLANPRNCEAVELSLQTDGTYQLRSSLRLYDSASNAEHIARN
jgi:broad specificity phosphatase PhoE